MLLAHCTWNLWKHLFQFERAKSCKVSGNHGLTYTGGNHHVLCFFVIPRKNHTMFVFFVVSMTVEETTSSPRCQHFSEAFTQFPSLTFVRHRMEVAGQKGSGGLGCC